MGTKLHKKSKTYFKIGEKLLFELSCIPHYFNPNCVNYLKTDFNYHLFLVTLRQKTRSYLVLAKKETSFFVLRSTFRNFAEIKTNYNL